MANSEILNIEDTSFQLRSDLHILRKLWHMLSGLIGLYIYRSFSIPAKEMGIALFILAFFSLGLELLRLRFISINRIVLVLMKPFMRECEKNSMSGLPFYALGCGVSLYFFKEHIAILSILFLIFSDPISSWIGIIYGKDKILANKSLQGCAAGLTVCYGITCFYGSVYSTPGVNLLIFAIVASVIGCLSELASYFIDDNFTIPALSGLGLTALNYFIPLF